METFTPPQTIDSPDASSNNLIQSGSDDCDSSSITFLKEDVAKLFASDEDDSALLGEAQRLEEPLLGSDHQQQQPSSDLFLSMETATPGGGDTDNSANMAVYSRGTMCHPLFLRTVADAAPGPVQLILTSGKMSVPVFFAAYLAFIALCFPFWLLSFLVTEWGVYALAVGFVFLVGRSVIRLIAFPGSSHRVSSEMEHEFAKYSVRMLVFAANGIVDLSSALAAASEGGSSVNFYEIASLWKRAKSYRDKVLAVFADTLIYILENGQLSSHSSEPDLTKYGNNRITGDIGNLSGLTWDARADGRVLLDHLTKVINEMDHLESQAQAILESTTGTPQTISPSVKMTAITLGMVAGELSDFVESLRPASSGESADDEDGDEELTSDAVQRRFEGQSGGLLDSIKSGLSTILAHFDPPLHTSIFGFDLQRGCMLSRYRGARQIWVPRDKGGKIDVLLFPAKSAGAPGANTKAVMYCNPNAGLIEVATGLSLGGGNVGTDTEGVQNDTSWVDFYTNAGYDVFIFNYAGYGRSHGSALCGLGKKGGEETYTAGVLGRVRRILHSTFCGFQPTPESLRADGVAVGSHILNHLGVSQLVIHGESIGGVAASGAANHLTQNPFTREKVALLICDRTFCNLEAVAQRLVGGWSGYAIRMLAPFWSTDVAAHFLAATCPKVVANDSADAIIADNSSLKSGISFWREIRKGSTTTKGVGWKMEAPLQYRMADWENVCVNDSRYVQSAFKRTTAPVWPADKHISLEEAFHFAACAKRIGKLSAIARKRQMMTLRVEAAEQGQGGGQSPIFIIWMYLGCCEGMCGTPLGLTVKGGFDCTVHWLCSTLTFGGQTVVEAMAHRLGLSSSDFDRAGNPVPSDFDCRPPGYESQESNSVLHPKPMPEVVAVMKEVMEGNPGDPVLEALAHELQFVLGTLEYTIARLTSPNVVHKSWQDKHLTKTDESMGVGSFLNLHCGHNNPFSENERHQLLALLTQACGS